MGDKDDCRVCINYSFDRDIEAETFHCAAGHYSYTDYGPGDISGKLPESGSVKLNPTPCNSKDFVLNRGSMYYKYCPIEG